MLLGTKRVRVGGAVGIALHDLLLRRAHAAPVVGFAGLDKWLLSPETCGDYSAGFVRDAFAGVRR